MQEPSLPSNTSRLRKAHEIPIANQLPPNCFFERLGMALGLHPQLHSDRRSLSNRGDSSCRFLRVLFTDFRLYVFGLIGIQSVRKAKTQIQRQMASLSND